VASSLRIIAHEEKSVMPDTAPAKIEQQTPQAQLIHMAIAYRASSLVYIAAEMNLADRLAEAPRTADELAESTGNFAPAMYRVMRTLAGVGLFTEGSDHRFSLTPLGEALRTDTPGSIRSTVLTLAGGLFTKSFGELHYSIKTGKPAFEKVFGMPVFEWLAKRGAIPPARPSKTPIADTCCIFCVAGGAYVNCGPTSAPECNNIAFTDAVWPLTALRLDVFLVNESAWPRGPPSVA
jgi:hypothetical protein